MAELPYAVERLIGLAATDAAEMFWAVLGGEPAKWIGLEAAWHGLAERVTASIVEMLRIMEVEHDAEVVGEAVKEAIGARMLVLMDSTGEKAGTA